MLIRTILFLLAFLSAAALAGPSVKVLALFPGKAMLEIDGQRKVLAAGKTGPGGVRLISADTDFAVVEIEGRRERLRLGSAVNASYKPNTRREIRILKDSTRDAYFVDGLINGQPVRFLVDTGATGVAMSERHARRLGLQHRIDGERIAVGTASGRAVGHRIKLRSVSVKGLQVDNIDGVVIEGDSPQNVLLGMSFLSEFEISQRANLLILRSRF